MSKTVCRKITPEDRRRAVANMLASRSGSSFRITSGQRKAILAGLVREDGAWHRRPGLRLVRNTDGRIETQRVGAVRWWLRWGRRG